MVPLLTFLNIQVQIYKGINEDNILNKNLSPFTRQIEIGLSSQACCLMGAWLPENAYVRFTHRQPKFQTRTLRGWLKLMILRLSVGEQTTKFLAHSVLLKRKQKTFSPWPKAKIILFPSTKGKQTSTCLEICFCDFRCSAVGVFV